MEVIWILAGFFALFTIVFIAIAFFYPEWVGITGQKARQIQEHQKSKSNDSFKPTETIK